MTTNYFTLRALVAEWRDHLAGAVVGDIFSHHPAELTLAYGAGSREGMVQLSARAPDQFIFRVDGYAKPRRNVAALLSAAVGQEIGDVRIAHRDRMIFMDLADGTSIQIVLFGPRANVFLVDSDGGVLDSFLQSSSLRGTPAPQPRPAPEVDDLQTFIDRWHRGRKSVAHALSGAYPLFDQVLAREAAFRVGIKADDPPELLADELSALFGTTREVVGESERPIPRIYWRENAPEAFSIVALTHLQALREEVFSTVDEALRVFVRRRLSVRRFSEIYDPLEKRLRGAAEHYRNSVERMLDELSTATRADRYEKWAHLLMAGAEHLVLESDQIQVEDLFEGGGQVTIPVDPSLTPVENAQRYYEKARRTRRSREEAEKRLVSTETVAEESASLLEKVQGISTLRDLEAFQKEHEDALSRVLPESPNAEDRVPFRRFVLPEKYEVWVGRNARQNDDLTFHHAQKHDLWMHARGVPGSHAVLRLPNRSAQPGKHILEAAAGIAAYFSKARGSSLVPVIVAPKKYVRKAKGGDPGAVIVEREEVILAEPLLPDQNF